MRDFFLRDLPLLVLVLILGLLVYGVLRIISLLKQQGKTMADQALTIDDLINAVAQETTVEQSIVTMLDGFAAQLRAIAASPGVPPATQQKINQLSAQIFTNIATMNAAIAANTSAAPTPANPPQNPVTPPAVNTTPTQPAPTATTPTSPVIPPPPPTTPNAGGTGGAAA